MQVLTKKQIEKDLVTAQININSVLAGTDEQFIYPEGVESKKDRLMFLKKGTLKNLKRRDITKGHELYDRLEGILETAFTKLEEA